MSEKRQGKDSAPGPRQAPSTPPRGEAELSQRVAQLERENRRLRERCEAAELQIVQLERNIKSVENTLSFRLGHALIQSTKSLNGLRALPLVLSELRRDNRRKKPGDDERSLIDAALSVSAGYAKRSGDKLLGTARPAATKKTKKGEP